MKLQKGEKQKVEWERSEEGVAAAVVGGWPEMENGEKYVFEKEMVFWERDCVLLKNMLVFP